MLSQASSRRWRIQPRPREWWRFAQCRRRRHWSLRLRWRCCSMCVQDPGNAGMILRAAAAANADAVLFGPGSVDPYNPKVLRGAMGGHFRTALHDVRGEAGVRACASLFAQRVVASARDGARYDTIDWTRADLANRGRGGPWCQRTGQQPANRRRIDSTGFEALNPSTWRGHGGRLALRGGAAKAERIIAKGRTQAD